MQKKNLYLLRLVKQKAATGILIFMLFNAKEFCILADKKINELVEQSVWDEISNSMSLDFKQENFCKGILNAVEQAGKILSTHFPIQPGDVNELSNEVRILD
ncbi:MAG: hypothetical protein MZV64_54075 [Ignavibacteriales bacterium]|nr:hypothetical protein [Ignavibacteriales bacterium]